MDALQFASGNRKITPLGRTPGEDDRIEDGRDPLDFDVDTHLGVDQEVGALGSHLLEAAVEDALLHLELGDAVAQQPAGSVGPLEDGDAVPGPGELLGGGQPGRAGADHRHRLAGGDRRRQRRHPPLAPRPAR